MDILLSGLNAYALKKEIKHVKNTNDYTLVIEFYQR